MCVNLASQPSLSSLFIRFLPYLRAQSRAAIVVAALVLLSPLATAALIWSFKRLLDDVLLAGRHDLLFNIATVYVVAAAIKIIVDFVAQRLEVRALESINLALRADIYAHTLSLSPESLAGHTSGDILTRMQRDAPDAEYLVFTGPIAILADAAGAIVYLAFLFYLSWPLTLVALAALAVIALLVSLLASRIRKASSFARRANSSWMSLAEERLDASQIVQAFDALDREKNAFHTRCGRVRGLEVTAVSLQALQSALVEATIAIGGLAVLGLGALWISQGVFTVGALVAFIGAAHSLFAPVRALAKAAGRMQHAAAGAQRVAALLNKQNCVMEAPEAHTLGKARGAVAFRDLRFAYPGDKPVLRGVSLQIEAGEMLAIVGESGSGKSSLMRLLLRQYDPASGAALIDGVDIRDLTTPALRAAISPVFQDAQILGGTIETNIRYGAPSASDILVARAAKAAAVDRFTPTLGATVGQRGARLSGGQRQRIALARALAHDGAILILDEATAGVDSQTEEIIQDALDALKGRKTLIIVAHRLSTILRADRVVVLEHGRIVESGSPAELMTRPSRCGKLFAAQISQREAAE